MRHLFLAAGLAALIAGSAAAQTKVEQGAGRLSAASRATGQVDLSQPLAPIDPLPVGFKGDGKVFAKRPKVAVLGYSVAFFRTGEARATAGGFGSESAIRSSKVSTYMTGISDADLQKIVDAANADLAERLKGTGVPVLTEAELSSLGEYAKVQWGPAGAIGGKGKIDGRAEKGWTTHAPSGQRVVNGFFFNPVAMGMMAAVGNMNTLGKLAHEADAILVIPQLGLDYADIESSGQKTWGGRASVSAETEFGINARSQVVLINGSRGGYMGPGGLMVKGPVGAREPFARLIHEKDSSDSAAISSAMAIMGLGSFYRQANTYEARVDAARYAVLAKAAYEGFNQAIVDLVKSGKGI